MNKKKEIKCLLVISPSIPREWPLIGVPYLSSMLKANGYCVRIEDLNSQTIELYGNTIDLFSKEDQIAFFEKNIDCFSKWVDKILDLKINFIGFTVWQSNICVVEKLIKLIKKRNSEIFIVCGGPDNNGDSVKLLLVRDCVDIVVHGEGEYALLEILDCYVNNKPMDKILGTACLNSEYKQIVNPKRPEIADINGVCFPDFSDFDFKDYKFNEIPLLFSRGCQWRCKFCSVSFHWNKFRTRSADNVFEEILLRLKQYERENYVFQLFDCAFNQDLKMLEELCDKIQSLNLDKDKIVFKGNAKIMPQMDYVFLKKMRKAGFREFRFGIESGSDKVLKLMAKPFLVKEAEQVLVDSAKNNIENVITIIVGFPGETEEDWDETICFIERVSESVATVFVNLCEIEKRFVPLYFADIIETDYTDDCRWRTKDLTNTYEIRKRRMEKLDENMKRLSKWVIETHGRTRHYSKLK